MSEKLESIILIIGGAVFEFIAIFFCKSEDVPLMIAVFINGLCILCAVSGFVRLIKAIKSSKTTKEVISTGYKVSGTITEVNERTGIYKEASMYIHVEYEHNGEKFNRKIRVSEEDIFYYTVGKIVTLSVLGDNIEIIRDADN